MVHPGGYTARIAMLNPTAVFILAPPYLAKTSPAVHTVTLLVFSRS
jgi:hypothetical protein